MTTKMQQRRGTAAAWTSANTVLAAGELGVETDTHRVKCGDGSTAWNSLSYLTLADGEVTSAKILDGTIVAGDVAPSTFAAFGTVGNLLTANQAIPTLGQWTVAASTESPAGTWTATTTGVFGAYVVITGLTAYATYTAHAFISAAGRDATVRLQFRDATDTIIGSTQVSNTISAGASGVAQVTAVAPVGTVSARLYLYCNVNGDAGDVLSFTQAGFWRGADGTWAMPGVPIVNTGIRPNPLNATEVQVWNDATATWITV